MILIYKMTFNKKKIRRYLQELRYILPTLYFNFHYLPFRQAARLSIVLYKPHLLACKGKIRLEPEDGHIHHGMIRLGFLNSSIYPNNGITWENKGGTVIFRGCIKKSYCVMGGSPVRILTENVMRDYNHDTLNY